MSLIGSLEQFDLANILRRIEVFSKTGLLVAKQGELWVEFYFRQGQLVCVGPMRANVTLVDRLLQAQLLSIQSLPRVKQIVDFSETNETRIALTLINEGLLSREILRAWSSHETSQILQTIISWSTGEIYFEDDCPTPADRLLIALSVSALLEALPAAMLAPRPAANNAPSTDELTHTPEHDVAAMFTPSPSTLVEVGPSGQMDGAPFAQGTFNASQLIDQPPAFNQPNTPINGGGMFNASQLIDQSVAFNQPNPAAFNQPNVPMNGGGMLNASQLIDQSVAFNQPNAPMNGGGMLNASQLIDQSVAFNQPNPPMNGGGMLNASQLIDQSVAFNQPNPTAFNQPNTPMNGGGMFNASQLIEDFPFNQAGAGGPVNTSQLVDNMPPPSFASANPSAMFGPEIDISASAQISILPPQPVRNPLPPARIDTSFMTPELVLAPVDLSTLRERNPQVQLTPDQWSLFGLIDGQVPLQALCQALNAPAEQICMVAGELIAIGLVMPLNPTTGALSEIMSQSAQYPAYVPQPPAMPGPNPFATPVEAQSQWGNGQNGVPFLSGGGWQPGQPGSAYAPVGGYR